MSSDFTQQILSAGVAAVEAYLKCAGPGFAEDSVGERSLSTFMAIELHNRYAMHAVPEARYTDLAKHLHIEMDKERKRSLLGLHADIALYDGGRPVALIELKILSDGKDKLGELARDLKKGDPAKLSETIPVYAAALICQTEKQKTLDEQTRRVEQAAGRSMEYSVPTPTIMPTDSAEKWHWCFGCVQRSDRAAIGAAASA